VARAAVQAVAGRLARYNTLSDELRLAGGRVALGARAGHNATALFGRVPVTERFLGTGEVAVVETVHCRHVDRRGDGGVQVFDAVVQQLDDVLATVDVSAGILQRHLIVVSCLGQAGRPGVEGVGESQLVFTGLAVGIGVVEEVRVRRRVIDEWRVGDLGGVGLHGRVERVAQTANLPSNTLFHVAVAVVVDQRAEHADVGQVFDRRRVGVARLALLQVDLERVRVVALDAGVVAGHVVEARVVRLAAILITTHRQRAILSGRRGVVVDIGKAQVFADRVQVFGQTGVGDLGVNRDCGRAALVADHAARLVAQILDLDPGGEDHAGLDDGGLVVASLALDSRTDGRGGVDDVRFAAVGTDVVDVARRAVAAGAIGGHLDRVFLVPVVERLAGRVVVRRRRPLGQERDQQIGRRACHRFVSGRGCLRGRLFRRGGLFGRRGLFGGGLFCRGHDFFGRSLLCRGRFLCRLTCLRLGGIVATRDSHQAQEQDEDTQEGQ